MIEVVIEVLIPELPVGLREIWMYARGVDADPLVEAVTPAVEGTLFITFLSILHVHTVTNKSHLGSATRCHQLLLNIEDC